MKSLDAVIYDCLAPPPVGGVTTKVANTGCPIATLFYKTNPIFTPFFTPKINLSLYISMRCAKIYNFVETQKQTQFKPNLSRRSAAKTERTQFLSRRRAAKMDLSVVSILSLLVPARRDSWFLSF